MADDLAALLDHLEVREAVIGGISMGAGVAAQFALRHADACGLWCWCARRGSIGRCPRTWPCSHALPNCWKRGGRNWEQAEFLKLPEVEAMRRICPGAVDSLGDQFRKPAAVERRARLRRSAAGPADRVLGRRGAARRARAGDWRSPRTPCIRSIWRWRGPDTCRRCNLRAFPPSTRARNNTYRSFAAISVDFWRALIP